MPDLVARLEQQIATWREEARAIEAVGHDGSYVAECADELSALCRAWQEEQGKDRRIDGRALASALKKVLPPKLLAEVLAHCDPLTPFLETLAAPTPTEESR